MLSSKLLEDEVKLKRVLKYIDYISYGDGVNLVCYGIKNKHYTIVAACKIVINEDLVSETTYSAQQQLCSRDEKDYLSIKFPDMSEYINFADSVPYLNGYGAFSTIPDGYNKADKDTYVKETVSEFLYGKKDISEFESFVKTLYDTFGQQKYDDLLNENLRSAKIIK